MIECVRDAYSGIRWQATASVQRQLPLRNKREYDT